MKTLAMTGIAALCIVAFAFHAAELRAIHKRYGREAEAVLFALEHLKGTPNVRGAADGYEFKTDAEGRVFMLYTDGWKAVE